jgi:hypothetical protein
MHVEAQFKVVVATVYVLPVTAIVLIVFLVASLGSRANGNCISVRFQSVSEFLFKGVFITVIGGLNWVPFPFDLGRSKVRTI